MASMLEFLPLLGSGLLVTITLAVASIACGLVLGFALSYLRMRNIQVVNVLIVLFADVFRCFPAILVLFILYYGLPFFGDGITLSAFTASWLGLALILAAACEEAIWTTSRRIRTGGEDRASRVSPREALGAAAPELVVQAIETVKLTALASFIVVPELFYTAKVWNASMLSSTPYAMAGLIYVAILWPVLRLSDRLRDRAVAVMET